MALIRDTIRQLNGQTYASDMTAAPGSAHSVTNMLFTAENRLEQRYGVARGATAAARINKLWEYEGYVLAHIGTGTMGRTDGSTLTTYSGTYAVPDNAVSGTVVRTQGCIADRSFYFTTSDGLFRISGYAATPVRAGVIAPEAVVRANWVLSGTGGFLPDGYQTAYRIVIGFKDEKGVNHYSAPSGRTVVQNVSGVTGYAASVAKNGTVRFPVRSDHYTTSHFYRVYRAPSVPATATPDIQPTDDLQLVYEGFIRSSDLTQGYVEFTDLTPDALMGEFIYTAPNAGDGMGQANHIPPLAKDICSWKGRLWAANTSGRHRLLMKMLALPDNNDMFVVTPDGASTREVSIQVVTSGSASQNLAMTCQNLVASLNAQFQTLGDAMRASYVSGPNDPPGHFLIEALTPGTVGFSVQVGDTGSVITDAKNGMRAKWAPLPDPPVNGEYTATRVGTTVTCVANGLGECDFFVGEVVTLSGGTADFPGGNKTVTGRPAADSFTYTEAGAATTDPAVTVSVASTALTNAESTADTFVNRVYYSKYGLGDAMPEENFLVVGTESDPILRIIPLRDQIFVFKKREGLFRITGNDESDFYVEPFDPTLSLFGPETPAFLGNYIYCLTLKGPYRISENGSTFIGQDIWGYFRNLAAASVITFEEDTFGWADETEQLYGVGLVYVSTDGPFRFQVYNGRVGKWTEYEFTRTGGSSTYDVMRSGVYAKLTGDKVQRLHFGSVANGSGNGFFYHQKVSTEVGLSAQQNDDYHDATGIGTYKKWEAYAYYGRNPDVMKTWHKVGIYLSGAASVSVSVVLPDGTTTSVTATRQASNHSVLWFDVPYTAADQRGLKFTFFSTTASERWVFTGLVYVYEEHNQESHL